MSKYFKEKAEEKRCLSEFVIKIETEYQEVEEELKKHQTGGYVEQDVMSEIYRLETRKRELSLPYARIKHIYSSLGDVQISEEMVETLFETFDSSKCRYGTICLKKETIQDIYEISELFPELSKEALVEISRQYIKDIFTDHSLIETLAIMLRKDGKEDSTFEKFISSVKELGDKADKKYSDVAWYIRIHCGEYPYDFVRHFEKFVQEHHISWERFCECLPSPEIILRDKLDLKEVGKRAKDCWGVCTPITFQMLEDYLDGDEELTQYEEQPSYYISTYGGKTDTSFTKTDFLKSIRKEQQKIKK